MTSVEQIVLSGIRSFNPDTSARQGIRFQKPVTIILGPNGSGKTTVIEALRNACTGEVPGKGASFIHDPKIAGETEVKAQIKLQFRTAANQQMLVGRSYQLTQGVGNKQKFETLDVSLQTRDPKNGQVVSQSYKCSDIDKLIPELLGISKAILDNVVFLHQDDTNWPLQEAAKLKKKFDDIFSSTRYTKALEELRKVVKDTKDRIKEHQLNLAVFKEKRAAAHQLRQQVEETQQTIEASAEHIKSIDKKIEGVVRRLEETCRESDGIQQLENDAMKLQGTVDALVQQREAMHSALHAVSEETDEELTGALAQFANLVQELKQVLAQTESKLRSFQNDHRSDDSAIFSLKSQRELLIAQSNEHQRRVQQLQSVIRETATSFSIPLPSVGDARIDENELLQFFEAFSSRIEALKQKRQAARTEARRAQEDTEKQVSDVRMKRDHVVMMQQGIDQRTEALRPKLRELKDRFNVLSTAEKDYEDASSRCKELEDARKTKLDEEARTNERLQALREQHEGFRVKADALREEAASRQEEQEAAHKLRMLRDERNRISSEVATRKSQLEGRFTDLVGRKVHGNYQDDINQSIRSKQQAIERMQRQVAEVDRELAVNRQQIEQHQGREAELKRLIASKEALYAELTREYDKDIPDLLKKAEAKEEKDRKAVATMQALQMCHDNFTSQADDEGCCPICARSMGDAELAVMQNNMAQKLRDVPAIVAKKEEALGKTQNLVRKVRALLPTHAEVARLREEHPKVSAHISTLSDRVEVQKVSLSDHTAQLDALRFEEKAFRELVSAVDKIRDLQDTMKSVENSIAAEESKIAAQHGAGVRPLDIVQKDIENKQQEMNNIVSAQQQAMKHAEEIRAEQSQLLDQIQRQRRLADEKQMQINERQRVRLQYDTSLEEYKKGTTESADLKQKRPQLEEQLLKLENEVKAQRAIGDSKEAQLSNEVEKQQQASSRMMALTSEVKRFIGENKSDILDATVSKLAGLESVQRERLQQIEVLEQKHTEYKTKIFQQDVTRRELEANVQYREKCRQVEKTQHELARFRHIIKEKSRGHEGVWKSLDHLRDEKAGMDRDRATIAGQMQATENLLRERQKELQSAKYDRIDERYNSTLIRLATMQMTEDDLQKYYGALDCALMKYHDEKITEINEVIRDLWIRTYRGQDIDYIELRSDIEAGASTGGASNRNYNYRVVMIKQGVALDMRGRCSAGQRVLASLVVRLALSQAFCCDCGILALDEPTTNLDVENIDSLAYALTEIISSRRGQSNFQLIIITHDEQFVRRIGHACGTEVVFHISRDPEGRFSVITEREFAEMM